VFHFHVRNLANLSGIQGSKTVRRFREPRGVTQTGRRTEESEKSFPAESMPRIDSQSVAMTVAGQSALFLLMPETVARQICATMHPKSNQGGSSSDSKVPCAGEMTGASAHLGDLAQLSGD
jgi:hypothetical protein